METQNAPRAVSFRHACLTLAGLCLLAALAGVVITSTDTGPHHRAHVVAAMTSGTDVVAHVVRPGIDAAPAHDTAADDAAITLAHASDVAGTVTTPAVDTLRMRGPPTAAA